MNFYGIVIENIGLPVNDSDCINRFWALNFQNNKKICKCAASTNTILSGNRTVDGVAVVNNDRVLVTAQTTQSQNGIYTVTSGAWVRASDSDTWAKLLGAYVWAELGTTNGDRGFFCSINSVGTLGVTAVTWIRFSRN